MARSLPKYSNGIPALGSSFNSTIEHFYSVSSLMDEEEEQEEEQEEERGKTEKREKESAWDLAVVIWLNHNLV